MRMHMLICVFAVVLLMVYAAAGDTTPTKRFKAWLQTRMKRDLHPEPQQNPQLDSAQLRSPRSPSGCFLPTCAYNDLIHMLHLTMDPPKLSPAPKEKLGSNGYGRRRRRRHSPLDVTRVGHSEA